MVVALSGKHCVRVKNNVLQKTKSESGTCSVGRVGEARSE